MAEVAIWNVEKVYPDGTRAVRSLTLDIEDGELVVLVGPSGCGKTTALRMVAGLEEVTSGSISIGGQVIDDLDPQDRDIAMVFQSYALYPHMSIYDNIAFPLKLKGVPRAERDAKVRRIARMLGLEAHLRRKPRQLSGGQRQRVAMGRAIVREPQAFLMDEPLSNLDAKLRVQMRGEILSLQKELGVTTIYVTHDQVEAMTLGDRVAVLRRGELQQFATPEALYAQPANLFVSAFMGSPPMNLLEGEVDAEGSTVLVGRRPITVDDRERKALAAYLGRRVVVGVRPERLEDAARASDAPVECRLCGEVVLREALGADVLVHLELEGSRPLPKELYELAHDVDDPTELEELDDGRRATVIARFGPTTRVGVGDRVEVVIRPGSLQFFDPQTGLPTS